jgi:hypothetical protein
LEDSRAKIISSAAAPGRITLAADSSAKLMDLNLPAGNPGRYTLWAKITDEHGEPISENNYEFRVK